MATKTRTNTELLDTELSDPAFRQEWERLAIARALAATLITYRAEHELSQRDLAQRLGIKQPQVARLESGEHQPSNQTLVQLASELGLEFTINISPASHAPRQITKRVRDDADALVESGEAVTRFAVA